MDRHARAAGDRESIRKSIHESRNGNHRHFDVNRLDRQARPIALRNSLRPSLRDGR
jgi:hypothetical protein